MPHLEADIRGLVNRGLDCTENSLRLLGARKELARLIGEWQAAGGRDLSLQSQQSGSRAAKREVRLTRPTRR
ncbi:MAG: hypothetical protein HY852_02080 [Bradyrhizobium sp.]|uniref:hypothetical protein n=1 Tax=Bradyrhizobium sp. TaxID=376 RepID=UPI0025C3CA52|nr:hypothetical protein [Bradyrhizobium sp.]MBI5260589.1 hypothetical protein [Bradyrhizobium sp.]